MAEDTAIAGVSRSLQRLLMDRMVPGQVPVTIAPPDVDVDVEEGEGGGRLNLFLYRISENTYLKHQEVPGEGHPAAYGRPPLALDLHYLVTAHGTSETAAQSDLQAQEFLGAAMRVLYEIPILTEDLLITRDFAGIVGTPILDPPLHGEYERVKVTLDPMSLEDLSKIWTALPEANFRRSVAYRVSVIRIESRQGRRIVRPVGEPPAGGPRVFALPFRRPHIDEIRVVRQDDPDELESPFPYARVGDLLVVTGYNFTGDAVRVLLGPVEAAAAVQDRRVEVTVPDDAELQPGPLTVQVIHDVEMGEPPVPHLGVRSNLCVLMLVPHVASVAEAADTVTVNGSRLFDADRECSTMLGDRAVPADDYTTATPAQVAFPVPGDLGAGDFAVRVRVDNVESFDDRTVTLP